MTQCNFAPAAPDEDLVYGACRPGYPTTAPGAESVADWIEIMDRRGIERVCCLLSDGLNQYDGLLTHYRSAFGDENVCHAPIRDYSVVPKQTLDHDILPFLKTSVARHQPVVVHCSAGQGRTGHVLALWLVHGREYTLNEAIQTVQQMGRYPLEAASRDDFREFI